MYILALLRNLVAQLLKLIADRMNFLIDLRFAGAQTAFYELMHFRRAHNTDPRRFGPPMDGIPWCIAFGALGGSSGCSPGFLPQ